MDKKIRIKTNIEHIQLKSLRHRFLALLAEICEINTREKRTNYDVVNYLLEMLNDLHSELEKEPVYGSEDLLDFSLLEGGDILKDEQDTDKQRKITHLTDNIKGTLSILQGVIGLKSQIEDLKSDLELKDQLIFNLQEVQKQLKLKIAQDKVVVDNANSKLEFNAMKVVNLEHLVKVNKDKYEEALQLVALDVKKVQNMDDNLDDIKKRNLELVSENKQIQTCLDIQKRENERSLKSCVRYREIFNTLNVSQEASEKKNTELKLEIGQINVALLVRDQEKAALKHKFDEEIKQILKREKNSLNEMNLKLQESENQRVAYFLENGNLNAKLKNTQDLIKDDQSNNELIDECKRKEEVMKGIECMKCEYDNLEVSLKVSQNKNVKLLVEIEKQ